MGGSVAVGRAVGRLLDANLNRAAEGLRVCEEIARLILEEPALTRRFQRLRYRLRRAAGARAVHWLKARDSRSDVGRPSLRDGRRLHRKLQGLAAANLRRAEEALRVLEEFSRLESLRASRSFASIRFGVYALEQDLVRRLSAVRHR